MHCLTELNDKQMEVRKVNIVVNVEFVADNGVAAQMAAFEALDTILKK